MSDRQLRRAAQYVRMSTEHQRYSIPYQTATNAGYALEHGYEIVRAYADEGISGLTIKRRPGLRALLADVVSGAAGFEVVLVYDVSRWGRFQDTDEAAHYEFLCRQGGVHVVYTAEPFENDGSLASSLVKHLKRAMAAEYSRDLSARIARVKRALATDGYWTAGSPGYALRRLAVDQRTGATRTLEPGEAKTRNERVRVVAGPPGEVATLQRIFRLFAITGLSIAGIAALLNDEGVPADGAAAWSTHRVRALLKNETYTGVLVLGRECQRLHERLRQPKHDWIRVPGAAPALVSPTLFHLAARHMRTVRQGVGDEALLDQLRRIHARHGRISCALIRADPEAACPGTFRLRFGCLTTAYARAGCAVSPRQLRAAAVASKHQPHLHREPPLVVPDDELVDRLRALLRKRGRLSVELINLASETPRASVYRQRFGGMRRAYALAGYTPSEQQERAMRARPGQSIEPAEAAELARASRAAEGGDSSSP